MVLVVDGGGVVGSVVLVDGGGVVGSVVRVVDGGGVVGSVVLVVDGGGVVEPLVTLMLVRVRSASVPCIVQSTPRTLGGSTFPSSSALWCAVISTWKSPTTTG